MDEKKWIMCVTASAQTHNTVVECGRGLVRTDTREHLGHFGVADWLRHYATASEAAVGDVVREMSPGGYKFFLRIQ